MLTLSVTGLPCPRGVGQTHHLVPVRSTLVCTYCGSSEAQIRRATPVMHNPERCFCAECDRDPIRRCVHCHMSVDVHVKPRA